MARNALDALARRANRLSLGVLGEPETWDPVIPPDLHDVKPPEVDADGKVACLYCGTRVAYETADMIGSDGMACASCRAVPVGVDTQIRRRVWPWFVGGAVLAGVIGYGIWHHEQVMDRREVEEKYPEANTPGDEHTIATALARWRPGPVLAGIASPPELATLHLGAACDASTEHAMELRRGEDVEAKERMAWLFEAAKRGRYFDAREREQVVAAIGAPILVIAIAEQELPHVIGSGANLTYDGGYRTGTAYLYDIDGTLRCAGSFDAESSEIVKYWTTKEAPQGDRKVDAVRAIGGDLETKMRAAIVAGLHRVP